MAPYHVPMVNSQNDKADSLDPATPKVPFNPLDLLIGFFRSAPKIPTKRPKTNVPRRPQPDDATADFAIVCDGGTLRAHKSLLIGVCPYFERLFRFNGKVYIISKSTGTSSY
jgi:hypothetical protein